MNDLGIALVWLFVQVTVVALAGLGLSIVAARRAPGSGAPAALTGLAAAVVLAALACCPLPAWWAWEAAVARAAPEPTADSAAGAERAVPVDELDGTGLQLGALLARLHALGRGSASADAVIDTPYSWPALVAALAIFGAALGVARLLLGLWAIERMRHRSQPVTDAGLLRLAAELGDALGVRRAVALRESTDLASAATVGWRRPIVLLPADWRGWSMAQRRAVMAHELAHVRRGDFAAWLVGRLGVAVHFWHPLVRALAARLQLQQEIAADAVAARLAGGRPAYLRALAELALGADDRAAAWPAPAFLSHRESLLRRIAMLRVTDDRCARPARPIVGRLILAVVCACTLVASAWRFPAHGVLAQAPAAEEVVPFDLALVAVGDSAKYDGFYGIRPAALLKQRAAEPIRKLINTQIDAVTAPLLKGGFGIHIEDIEQIIGRVTFGGENKPGKRALMMSLNVLRTTRDIDWVKLRDRCGTLFKKHEWHGDTYVSIPTIEPLKSIAGTKGDMYLWAADARTLVLDSDTIIKAHIERKATGKKLPLPAYAAGWDKVSRSLFAMALDNRGGRLARRIITDDELKDAQSDRTKPESHAIRLLQRTAHLVAGCTGDDDIRVTVHAVADNADNAAALADELRAVVTAAKALDGAANAGAPADVETLGLALLQKGTVRQSGSAVTLHAQASGFNALLAAWAKEVTANEK